MNAASIAISAAAAIAIAGTAGAECASSPIKHSWNVHDGDQRVSGEFVSNYLVGKRAKYQENSGVEIYGSDGSYTFQDKGGTHNSNGYVFYGDGSRCIDYGDVPRYDLYVVREGKFILINVKGGRSEARITK